MANRYQDRAYREEHVDGQYGPDRGESDPLAELARLVGQTDPFGPTERSTAPAPRSAAPREPYEPPEPPPEPEEEQAAMGPPPWIQRANLRRDALKEAPREIQRETQKDAGSGDYLGSMHRARRYAQPQQEDYYQDGPASHEQDFAEAGPALDPSRYDDARYGQIEAGFKDHQHEPADPDDPYAYESDYDEETQDHGQQRRGGLITVAAVLALAVVGTGAAWAYRTYFSSAHSGEPPIIKADNSPTKIIPASSDSNAKVADRVAPGDGAEKMVSREEPPVDVNAQNGAPQVAFPPLKDNDNPPSPASVSAAPTTPPPAAATSSPNNGTLPNGEPRKVKTLAVHGDEPDASAAPANPQTAPAKAARKSNASAAMPLSLTPQSQSAQASEPRVAATTPAQTTTSGGGGGYLVQVSSQRNEADAQASFKSLQNKFPSVLGSQTPVIKRADLGEKGVYYRAMVGPFGTSDEANQLCGNLKNAGGQCVVQKN